LNRYTERHVPTSMPIVTGRFRAIALQIDSSSLHPDLPKEDLYPRNSQNLERLNLSRASSVVVAVAPPPGMARRGGRCSEVPRLTTRVAGRSTHGDVEELPHANAKLDGRNSAYRFIETTGTSTDDTAAANAENNERQVPTQFPQRYGRHPKAAGQVGLSGHCRLRPRFGTATTRRGGGASLHFAQRNRQST
jgi:hypothetical protein